MEILLNADEIVRHLRQQIFVIQLRMFTLPWLPRKGLAKTGVRKDPSPKKRCIVYLRHKTRLITDK